MNHQPLRIYVAGASVERRERAIPAIASLLTAGLEVTHDWTAEMEKYTNPEHSDEDVPETTRKRCAVLDLNGVRTADFVLLLAPNERGSSGAWIEMGFALGLQVPLVISGPRARRSIFASLAYALFETDEEAIKHLVEVQRERG